MKTRTDKLAQAMSSIDVTGQYSGDEYNTGEYGLHDCFFNFLVTVDDLVFYVQGCADNNVFDASDCGHDDGICGDVNLKLAEKLSEDVDCDISDGYADVQLIIEEAKAVHWLMGN